MNRDTEFIIKVPKEKETDFRIFTVLNGGSINTKPINYDRLVEIATLLKDGLMEDDEEQALIYMKETIDMTNEEAEFFGVNLTEVE